MVIWFKLLSQFGDGLSIWTFQLRRMPWSLNNANLESKEALFTTVRTASQSQTRLTSRDKCMKLLLIVIDNWVTFTGAYHKTSSLRGRGLKWRERGKLAWGAIGGGRGRDRESFCPFTTVALCASSFPHFPPKNRTASSGNYLWTSFLGVPLIPVGI